MPTCPSCGGRTWRPDEHHKTSTHRQRVVEQAVAQLHAEWEARGWRKAQGAAQFVLRRYRRYIATDNSINGGRRVVDDPAFIQRVAYWGEVDEAAGTFTPSDNSTNVWAPAWVLRVAELGMLAPTRHRILDVLEASEEAWQEFFGPDGASGALGATAILGGKQTQLSSLVLPWVRAWEKRLGEPQPPDEAGWLG